MTILIRVLSRFVGVFAVIFSVSAWTATDSIFVSDTIPNNFRRLSVQGGVSVGLLESDLGWGVNAGLDTQLDPELPFYLGLDLGYQVWEIVHSKPFNRFSAGQGGQIRSIHALPTFYYRFFVPSLPAIFPYIGLSLGPNFSEVTTRGVNGENNEGWSFYGELLLRVGFTVLGSKTFSMNIEPKVGWMGGSFIFLPQLNGVITI